LRKTKSIPAALAVLAIGAIGAESAIGGAPYPVEIKVQKAKPTKVKGMVIGARNPCTNRVPLRITGKGGLQAKGRTNSLGIFRVKPEPPLKAGRHYKAVVRRTTDAEGETRCERAVQRFKARRSGATPRGENGPLAFGGLDPATHTVQVYRLAPGGAPVKLTSAGEDVWHECPAWSADGRLIYFDRFDRATNSPAHIYRIDATGGSPQLSDKPGAPTHLCPSVDWTGRWVTAIQYGDNDSNSIIRMRTDGTNRRAVARAGKLQNVYSPHFAPDSSRRILFFRVTFKAVNGVKRSDLLIVNRSGRKRNITRRSRQLFGSPSWSPNGSTILAVRGAAEDEIVRMNARGRHVRRLVKVHGANVHLSDPTFSPDGSKIAYARCAGDCGDPEEQGTGSIWVMNADGSKRTKILAQATAGVQPVGDLDWGVSAP
jgi:hypothetical protein